MVFGVPYFRHDGPPRDVTLRCQAWIWLEHDGQIVEGLVDPDNPPDPTSFVQWREVFESAYTQDNFCKLISARLVEVEWEDPGKVVMTIALDIVFYDEDEALSSLAARFSEDWDHMNDSFEVPAPWTVHVGGSCEPLDPPYPPEVNLGESIVRVGEVEGSDAIVVPAGSFHDIAGQEVIRGEAAQVSAWLAGLPEGPLVATMKHEGQVFGFFQNEASRYQSALDGASDGSLIINSSAQAALLEIIATELYSAGRVSMLPRAQLGASWERPELRATYDAIWITSRKSDECTSPAVVTMVPTKSSDGTDSQLTAEVLWACVSGRQYWSGLPRGVPEVEEVDAGSLGAPFSKGLRVWRLELEDAPTSQ